MFAIAHRRSLERLRQAVALRIPPPFSVRLTSENLSHSSAEATVTQRNEQPPRAGALESLVGYPALALQLASTLRMALLDPVNGKLFWPYFAELTVTSPFPCSRVSSGSDGVSC